MYICTMFVRRKTDKNSPKIAIQLVENIKVSKNVNRKIWYKYAT